MTVNAEASKPSYVGVKHAPVTNLPEAVETVIARLSENVAVHAPLADHKVIVKGLADAVWPLGALAGNWAENWAAAAGFEGSTEARRNADSGYHLLQAAGTRLVTDVRQLYVEHHPYGEPTRGGPRRLNSKIRDVGVLAKSLSDCWLYDLTWYSILAVGQQLATAFLNLSDACHAEAGNVQGCLTLIRMNDSAAARHLYDAAGWYAAAGKQLAPLIGQVQARIKSFDPAAGPAGWGQ